MKEKLLKALPEFLWIKEETLRQACVNTYADALTSAGWAVEDMEKIPFTLLIPNCPASYLVHVRAVTRMCHVIYNEFVAMYQGLDAPVLDYDVLIAGALLHDVGKLVEYTKTSDGKYVKSAMGQDLRHPFSGTVIAMRNGISSRIAHTIANHAKEGDGTLRTPEAVIINKADILNFEAIKSHRGMA
ncbi:MAG: HD domain-containing protein [Negativicutes bacterium]|nr:HD domain-containing protein [Negativicutes bacterium]